MQEIRRMAGRTFCVLLVLCFMAVMASPMASALTSEQEKTLQSGQRSINNPKGTFSVPKSGSAFQIFQKDSLAAGQMIVSNLLRQLVTGHTDPEFTQIMAYAPLAKMGDDLPPQRELSFAKVLKALFTEGMNNLYIVLLETEQENLCHVIAFYTNWKGDINWTTTGILYDAKTGVIQGADDTGVWGMGKAFDLDQFMSMETRGNSNRKYGFNVIFDWLTPLVLMNLQTLRFPFEYNDKDYMLQFWKGSYYVISDGAEVGIYERPKSRLLHWDASDTELEMTMKMYQKDELFYEYGPYRTWWTGAFRYGNPILMPVYTPKNLRLTGTILFEDTAMLGAFLASFEANRPANMTGRADGLLFEYDWQIG